MYYHQFIDEVLDEEAHVNPLQDTYDPAEGEGQSAEHDDAKGVHIFCFFVECAPPS